MFLWFIGLEQRRVKGKWKLDVIVEGRGGERNGGQGKVQSYNEEALHGQILYFVLWFDETDLTRSAERSEHRIEP